MPKMVLIVEDNEACADTLQIALEQLANVHVLRTASASEALRVLDTLTGPPSAVITDLDLPGMSGLDLLVQLRSDARYCRMPVFVVTGQCDPRTSERALSAGANAFFAKPYSPTEVRRRLEQLIT